MKKKKNDILENLDFSFLPPKLEKDVTFRIKKSLDILGKVKWPIQAVVLGGGYKNKEITYNEERVLSDIDLFVFSNFILFFWKKVKKAEEEINKDSLVCFDFRGVIPLLLNKSRTPWAFKLKKRGIVLRGDKNILHKVRAEENNMPKIEAVRILFRTLTLWINLLGIRNKENKLDNSYIILRSYLNIGESYLTFFGCLAPSYKEKLDNFKKLRGEIKLDRDLADKIESGIKVKINYSLLKEESEKYNLSVSGVKSDCLRVIDNFLGLYLKTDVSLEKKLEFLDKKVRPKIFFNFVFFWFLRNIRNLKPRFFQILLHFKITDFWKMILYNERKDYLKFYNISKKYFKSDKISEEMLIKIFEAHPSLSTVEII